MENVMWMFDEDSVQPLTTAVQSNRDEFAKHLPLMRAIVSCKENLGDKKAWGGDQVADLKKRMEDRSKVCAHHVAYSTDRKFLLAHICLLGCDRMRCVVLCSASPGIPLHVGHGLGHFDHC